MKKIILMILVVSLVATAVYASSRFIGPWFFNPHKGGVVYSAGDKALLEGGDYILLETGDKIILE